MPEIEKNVPIPFGHVGRPRKYPFAAMEVGDSVFFPNEPAGALSKPGMAAYTFAIRHGLKFSVRSENGGVRIWRVK